MLFLVLARIDSYQIAKAIVKDHYVVRFVERWRIVSKIGVVNLIIMRALQTKICSVIGLKSDHNPFPLRSKDLYEISEYLLQYPLVFFRCCWAETFRYEYRCLQYLKGSQIRWLRPPSQSHSQIEVARRKCLHTISLIVCILFAYKASGTRSFTS
jgi:hypothetical protein